MRLSILGLVFLMSLLAQSNASAADSTAESKQLLVVTVPTWNSTTGQLQRLERDGVGGPWRKAGSAIPISIGRSGLAWGSGLHTTPTKTEGGTKKEGDGRSPAGIFSLMNAFGYAPMNEMKGLKFPYEQCTSDLRCVDDAASPDYNRIIPEPKTGAPWKSAEIMRRDDELYRLGVVVAHNQSPRLGGGGSCIFLHIWTGPGGTTSGCTAMAKPDIEALVAWLDSSKRPLMVQWPETERARLATLWNLKFPEN